MTRAELRRARRTDGRPAVGSAGTTLRIRPTDLHRTAPAVRAADDFVAQLGTAGLGAGSFVVARHPGRTPDWIVLDYAADGCERVWCRTRHEQDGMPTYLLVEDDSSTGYISA